MNTLELISKNAQLVGSIAIAITAIIILAKVIFKKLDKNKNGKIETEEISKEDLAFLKEMLKESFKTIASGLINENKITGKKAYNLIFENLKRNKKAIENLEKENKENEIQKNNK